MRKFYAQCGTVRPENQDVSMNWMTRSSSGWVLMVTIFYIWKVWYQSFPKPCRVSSYDIWLFFLNIVENAQNNTNFWFFCVTRKYRYRGDTQDVVWRRSIRFWEAQRSYFSSLKPLKWPSDPWVTFGQHLLPKIWPKNDWKSPFSTFLKGRGVLRDEFLSWPKFQNFENII